MSQPQSGHENVAPYYDLHAPRNIPEMLDFFDFAVGRHARRDVRRVLELGIGTGRFAIPLAGRGYEVTGTDGSPRMLDLCRQKAERNGVKLDLRQEWFQELKEIETFDAVVAIFTALGFLKDDQEIRDCIAACLRATRPGGFVLIDVPNSLQGLIEPWAGCSPQTFAGDGYYLERFLEMVPHPLEGVVRYRDRGIVYFADGTTRTYKEEFTLRLFSLPLLRLLLEPLRIGSMTCYCNWTDREPMQPPYERLILVLEKR